MAVGGLGVQFFGVRFFYEASTPGKMLASETKITELITNLGKNRPHARRPSPDSKSSGHLSSSYSEQDKGR